MNNHHQLINLSTNQPNNISTFQPNNKSTNQPNNLSTKQQIDLSTFQLINLSTNQLILHNPKRNTMLIKDIITAIETEAPLAYQESYDNCGLQVGKDRAVTVNSAKFSYKPTIF